MTRMEADVFSYLDISRENVIKLCDELCDYGITTFEQFEEAFFYQTDMPCPIHDFVQFILTDIECVELPSWVSIDEQHTWDSALRHDFYNITVGSTTYFFHNL